MIGWKPLCGLILLGRSSLSLHHDDGGRTGQQAGRCIPNWCRWSLMFLVAVPYVYGGIAKLNGDWLQAMPVGAWISERGDMPVIGRWLKERQVAWVISYFGLLFDLFIVPLLLWRRTRLWACAVVVAFHMLNSVLFAIDVFPWMMILLTPILFPADWPRRLLRRPSPDAPQPADLACPTGWQRATVGIVGVFVVWQLIFPFRHVVYPGDASWTEEGHQFAWRMMLRRKEVFIRFYATDQTAGTTVEVPIDLLLSPRQIMEVAVSPDQIVAVAPFLAQSAQRVGLRNVSIRAIVLASLNGRKPQLLIDPDLDLLTVQRTWRHQPWIMALTEPLRPDPWDVPSDQWPEVLGIELPKTTIPPGLKKPDQQQ